LLTAFGSLLALLLEAPEAIPALGGAGFYGKEIIY